MQELLVKYFFTSEKLSIQTCPDDDQEEAAAHGLEARKNASCYCTPTGYPGLV